jgi:GT2 family glycosyltransferase
VKEPEISIVVLNYNGRHWLGPCLEALAAQEGAPPFEVIVVDNASTDGSAEIVGGRHPGVRLVQAGSNLGFAAGNNLGAAAARGSILAFLNNDTRAMPDWVGQLYRAFSARPGEWLVGSRIVFMDDPGTIDSAGDGYFRAGGAYKRGHGRAEAAWRTSQEVFGACGAAFMIGRELFERLGGFDPRFFMVYEDVDLCYRARLAGARCWYAADAVVRHAGSATLGRLSSTAIFYGQRNLEWTWIKNTPWPLLWRTAPAHVLYAAAGVLYYARIGRGLPALRGKLAAIGGLSDILRTRRRLQRERRTGLAEIVAFQERGWLRAKRREKARESDGGPAASPRRD